jgi:hypothetical protein
MPKVIGPLFSLKASGTLAELLTYQNRGTTQRVRRYVRSTVPPSPLQAAHRAEVAAIAAAWRSLSPLEQTAWRAASAALSLAGWSYYWREYVAQECEPPDHPSIP